MEHREIQEAAGRLQLAGGRGKKFRIANFELRIWKNRKGTRRNGETETLRI